MYANKIVKMNIFIPDYRPYMLVLGCQALNLLSPMPLPNSRPWPVEEVQPHDHYTENPSYMSVTHMILH